MKHAVTILHFSGYFHNDTGLNLVSEFSVCEIDNTIFSLQHSPLHNTLRSDFTSMPDPEALPFIFAWLFKKINLCSGCNIQLYGIVVHFLQLCRRKSRPAHFLLKLHLKWSSVIIHSFSNVFLEQMKRSSLLFKRVGRLKDPSSIDLSMQPTGAATNNHAALVEKLYSLIKAKNQVKKALKLLMGFS